MANTADQARQGAMDSWQNQIIKSGSTISATTASGVNAVTTNPIAVELYNMTDAQRMQIAQSLKNAGYKVPSTGKFNDTLVAQWSNVTRAAQIQAQSIGQPFDGSYLTGYLQQQQIANAAMDTGTSAQDFQRKTIYDPTQAAAVINTVYSDLLGRQASQKELDKYTKALQKAQASNPLKYTNTAGPGYTQQGGLDPQQFLIQQISGTDEAKANQVMNYYSTFKNLIGVK